MIRALDFALVPAILLGLILAGCMSAPKPEGRVSAEGRAPLEAEQGGGAGATGPAPEPAGEQEEPAQEPAGVSLSGPPSPADQPEPGSGILPEPGAETSDRLEVYSVDSPPAPQEAPAGRPLPLPRTTGGEKSAAPKAVAASSPTSATEKAGSSSSAAKTQAPATAANTPASAPQERRREVLARKGDTVTIELEGKGWLFLGLPPSDRNPGVSYLSADAGGTHSSFSFKALEYGEYDLGFQLQDNTRGLLRNQTVRLRVLPDEQFSESVARQAAVPQTAPLDPAQLAGAERLFAARAFDLALAEYLKLYREGDPLLNDRLAAIYAESGEPAAAAKYFQKNLSAPDPYGERAVVGLVRAGLALGSEELVHEQLKSLLEVHSLPIGRELLDTAHFLKGRGRAALALDLLQEYLRRYDRGDELDRAWFLLAQLYELDSPLRDVAKARKYYAKIYEELPESAYAAEARARIRYLDRYFFNVQ
jgi:hypothetical protein